MGIKTEDFVKNLPPKEITEGIDWLGILDSFDPNSLDEKYLNECAGRNPFYTYYGWDTPAMPISERLEHSAFEIKNDRQALEEWANRIREEGLNPSYYKHARIALIKANP